jgi:hypothetical protein
MVRSELGICYLVFAGDNGSLQFLHQGRYPTFGGSYGLLPNWPGGQMPE